MTEIKVGNYTISERDVDNFINALPQEQQMYRSVPQFREQCKERLEEICLFAMLGEEEKQEDSAEYKEAIAMARRDLLSQLAMANLLKDITVSDEEAKSYYEENKENFAEQANAKAKHVLVDTEDKANEIKEEILSGAKSFEEAAKEYSTCPSSAKGGDLGSFGKGQMVKEFEEAVFNGELKQVIGPVKTQFGYHLIWVDEKNEGTIPDYEKIAEKVRSLMVNQKQKKTYDAKLAELRKKYM